MILLKQLMFLQWKIVIARKDYMYQLEQFKPSSVVHIFHNKGFNKCEKKLNDKVIENSTCDIIHAYKNAFTHAKNLDIKIF